MTHKALIKMKSTVDGAEIYNEYEGEYKFENGAINIFLRYGLNDGSGEDEISGTQEISIKTGEEI